MSRPITAADLRLFVDVPEDVPDCAEARLESLTVEDIKIPEGGKRREIHVTLAIGARLSWLAVSGTIET